MEPTEGNWGGGGILRVAVNLAGERHQRICDRRAALAP